MWGRTTLQWWQWPHVRRRLEVWARSLYGLRRRCRLRFDAVTPTGRCRLDSRQVWVNPALDEAADPPRQIQLTRGLLAHEVGHLRFTSPYEGEVGKVLHHLVNILEDERIERLMCRVVPSLRAYFRLVNDYLWSQATARRSLDDPWEIIGAALQWSWEHRMTLDPADSHLQFPAGSRNAARWETVRPLVEQAWEAPDTAAVTAIARQILEYLGLPEDLQLPQWLLELLEQLVGRVRGERVGEPDEAPDDVGADDDERPDPDDLPDEDLEVPDPTENQADGYIVPEPFERLEEAVRGLADRLVEELSVPDPVTQPGWVEHGGRYSVRADMRTYGERPFVAPAEPGHRPPRGLVVDLLVDRSGSMKYRSIADDPMVKHEAARRAMMMLYLACHRLRVPLSIMAFEDNVLIKEYDQWSPMCQALIAGYQGITDREYVAVAMRTRRPRWEARPEQFKLMIVLHDGMPVTPDDRSHLADLVREMHQPRRGQYVLGLYLGAREDEIAGMRQYFGDRLIVCRDVTQLPHKLANLLRAWRGRG